MKRSEYNAIYTGETRALSEHPFQTSPNSQLATADVSWRSLLAPLDVGAAATVALVLQLVPVPLAGPVLQCLAKAWHGQELPGQSADNIVWKCAQYLPGITRGQRSVAPLPASLAMCKNIVSNFLLFGLPAQGQHACVAAPRQEAKSRSLELPFRITAPHWQRIPAMSCVPPVRAGALVIQAAPSRFWAKQMASEILHHA